MSARDVTAPGREMQELLQRVEREVRATERRQSWTSAVQENFADIDTAGYTSIQSTAAGGYPTAGATSALTMTLDPGRWIVNGHAVHRLAVTNPNTLLEIGIVLEWSDGVDSDQIIARAAADYPISYTLSEPTAAGIEILSENEITVTLSVFAGCEPGYSAATYRLYTVQLLAFPG